MTYTNLVHVDTLSCETILRKTPDSHLIIVSQCGGLKEPSKENRVYVFHSLDQGRSWSKKQLIMPDNGMAVYCTEVTVVEHSIFAFLTLHNGNFLNFESIVLVSKDSGYTWEKYIEFPKLEGFYFIRGAIKLSNGDILFPYQQYLVSQEENDELVKTNKYIWNSMIKHCVCGIIRKSKKINDFIISGDILIPLYQNNNKLWQWPEPTIAELSDHSIVMLIRINKSGYLYKSYSSDEGLTWSLPNKTNIKNPGNKPKLIHVDKKRIALINTFNDGDKYTDRFPLSIWISNDDLKTWSYKKDVVTFPGWLSYPDGISVSKNKIQFAFEFNRHDIYFVEHVIEKE